MKKKILIYTMIMKKGGTEQQISNLANHFINIYDITIVTNIKSKLEYDLHPNIKYLNIDTKDKKNEKILKKIITKLSLKRTKKLKKIIENEKPDLILSFLPEPTIRMLSLKKYFPNIPMLFSIRNHPKSEFNLPFCKFIRNHYYKKADRIIIQDEKYQKYLKSNIQDKLIVIPNFISDNFINVKEEKNKNKLIVTVTRLEKQKNLDLLIAAFSKLDKKFNDYKLHIIGEGKEKQKLIKKIKKLNLEDRIVLRGKVKSVPDEIKKATLFVLPSNYEGMPNVLLEAMSLSLPVISTNSTEVITSIIENNINGLIIEKNNKKVLTASIEYLLNNPAVCKRIGKEAKKIKDVYSKNNIIDRWDNILKEYL